MSALRQLLKSSLTSALPMSWLITRGPRRSMTSGRVEVALTFDDGPHPEHTPRILDLLAASHFQATFFVIGEKAERHPDLIRRIATAGHELGTHTWTHSEPSKTSTAQFLQETQQSRRLLQDMTGHDCRLMRPPKGELTFAKTIGLWRQRQTIALWNVDPKDFVMTQPSEMKCWCDTFQPASGDIILLHDNHSHAVVCLEQLSARRETKPNCVTLSTWLNQSE